MKQLMFFLLYQRVCGGFTQQLRGEQSQVVKQAVKTGDHLVRLRYTVYSSWIIHKSPLTLPLGDQPRKRSPNAKGF